VRLLPGQEAIFIDGERMVTLRERLRPGLKAVIVGFNPSPVSVAAGHYYQGQLGKRLWSRLQQYELTTGLAAGREDDSAFALGFGFADLVRRPTARANALTTAEKSTAVTDLVRRLLILPDRPLVLFVFAGVARLAGPALTREGFQTRNFPGHYAARSEVAARMAELKRELDELSGNRGSG